MIIRLSGFAAGVFLQKNKFSTMRNNTMFMEKKVYQIKNKIRIVSAASLFDGHDAAINIMRRLFQAGGCEVIHLGHNRSVQEIVDCAIEEDAQAIALTSYQGGHCEFLKYMVDLLKQQNCHHIKIFAGGGGVILPDEIKELHDYGITRIYSPDDGRSMGLWGMISDVLEKCDFPLGNVLTDEVSRLKNKDRQAIARLISTMENFPKQLDFSVIEKMAEPIATPIIGITGTGGSGKSSLVDELINRFLHDFSDKTVAIISVDPSKRKTGGALLGDRIRMNSIHSDRVYMRSLATRQSNLALSKHIREALTIVKAAGFDMIILETSGIGQSDSEITDYADLCLYVMTPEYGAGSQLEKIDMLDFADVIVLNKSDKRGALDALRDVRKQFRRNHEIWDGEDDQLPVFSTIASQYNDPGVHHLYAHLIKKLNEQLKTPFKSSFQISKNMVEKKYIIPPKRNRYLSEIADAIRHYNSQVKTAKQAAQRWFAIEQTLELIRQKNQAEPQLLESLKKLKKEIVAEISPAHKKIIDSWPKTIHDYRHKTYTYTVRDKEIQVDTHQETLAHTQIPKISLPRYEAWGDILQWCLQENVPGEFPFTAGVFPFKREGEDPTRQFAGEGAPERTNKRFHYLCSGQAATRLSTAFDSVTLYGEDPHSRPDIYGKIGNSGVSVCCLDDAKKLYSGFHLTDAKTSVSMTINGPAPIMTAFFMNTAIDQECELYIKKNGLEKQVTETIKKLYQEKGMTPPKYHGEIPKGHDGLGLMLLGVTGDQVLPPDVYQQIKAATISQVRGTVQADILKEDQAQNTCIFSTEFALKMMGDIQQYFIENCIRNFYSVSISGYHIAEAGANPITQLALTLSNGFTYVEYYLSRGMDINQFAPNLSFFFSNGIDAEYAVIGRVARRIWAKAMKLLYGGDDRSQKLKYHIQTSGRSLHAQEIGFNDIRTTLQALYAIYDNCNSLHTNAYDEAITTPTEESVRRAMAIQLIINHELGLAKNQNPMQGSFIIEELTDLVEEAVLTQFDNISERGGVLGAMETNYQRNQIQEESHYYESLKHSGEYPIIGVNRFLSADGSPTVVPGEVIRATEEEKQNQLNTIRDLHTFNRERSPVVLAELQQTAKNNENIFNKMMDVVKYCSIGQISNALYKVGGQYRRNM
jgi:methylmalonyl-CoA mutase